MSRSDKVSQAIKREVSNIIHNEMKDPRLGFVTITRVELTDDLRFAKIFYSVLGEEAVRKKSGEALESALGFIRKLVSERIKLRFSPEMVFKVDRSSEYSTHIEEILNELKGRKDDEKSC
ncbi:MAG: 30S ribosome-binding factor RbfA [Candidatus Omnitrophota bacterium]|jgi:ribosome-binding factor A